MISIEKPDQLALSNATIQDMKYANTSMRKARAEFSKVCYSRTGGQGTVTVYGKKGNEESSKII